MKVPNFIRHWVLMEGYRASHAIARKICWLGFENPPNIQTHLDRAKDELYAAAAAFKNEAININEPS